MEFFDLIIRTTFGFAICMTLAKTMLHFVDKSNK